MSDVVVIGGGLVGLATARALRAAAPGLSITLLEKEDAPGLHQSTHNSGVLHAGLAYAPGSRKALLAREGVRRMVEFCGARGIAHDVCGKLVLATEADQLPRLEAMRERGTRNGLTGLRILSPEEAREIEPHAGCVAALHVPEEGIVDFAGVCDALARELRADGVEIRTRQEVVRLTSRSRGWRVFTRTGAIDAGFVVGCAGLQADRLAAASGARPPVRIVPFRGEYYRLRPERESLVRNLIYPLPEPGFPFLGVHFTRRITGGIEAGPNAVLAMAREGYRKHAVDPGDLVDAVAFPGVWRFAMRHPRMVAREVGQSLSRRRFLAALRRLVPDVSEDDLVDAGAGVRAQAMLPSGALVDDFLWVEQPRALHVLNAPSPAATASLAIGERIAARVTGALGAVHQPSVDSY